MVHDKTINVLVTGVGAIIGYGIIRNLLKSKYTCHVIGIDIFSDAVGQYWCNKFIKGVRADSIDFIEFINSTVINEKIDIVIPGIEQDLEAMVQNFDKMSKNAKYALNNKALFDIFNDKQKTYDYLKQEAELIPNLYFEDSLFEKASSELGLPFILKQNVSYASKGVAVINSKEEYDKYFDEFSTKCMIQKKMNIKDSEYTCSIFGLGDGSFVNPICLQRELSLDGSTRKATNIDIDEILLKSLQSICKKCKFEGATNLQFIKSEDKYFLLEINARVSSSTSMREQFGINEAEMILDYYLFDKVPETKEQKKGTIIRYIEDAYFDSDNI